MHWAARLYRQAVRRLRRTPRRKPVHNLRFESLELRLAPAVALGDMVFRDVNNNGTLDTGETGVAGVSVELLDQAGTTVVDTTTTNSSGVYTFAAVEAGTYRVRLAESNFTGTGALLGFTASGTSEPDPEDNQNNDSNGVTSGTLGQANGFIVSGPIVLADNDEPIDDGDTDPNTNLTLDFGVVPPAATGTLTLGDQVWNDADNNGTFDSGETGVAGVVVELLDASGTTVLDTTTTNSSGVYTFTELDPGTYRVRLAESNFTGAGVLVGHTSSTGASSDPNDNIDDNDDGSVNGTLGTDGVIISAPITLADDDEPINDGDTDPDTNLSLDFGVVLPVAGTLTLGNLVWNDTDNDGTFDTGETGINGVTVQLLSSTGTVLQTTTTANGGLYTFTTLSPGDYRVRLAEANFQTGGALVNFTSSPNSSSDPDDNQDNNDDGDVSGTLGQANGFIQSALITLTDDNEPINDGDTNPDTNLTLDFGVTAAPAGNLTLGDRVFQDINNNGSLDGSDFGLTGVTVQLLNAQGTVVATTTTNATGNYTFANLAAGDYRVRLPASNFESGGGLIGFTSSTNTASDPDDNQNNNDDGAPSGNLGSGGFIESALITLSSGNEPTNDGDTSNNTNLTLDFGLVAPANSTLTLGNTIWNDANNNGLLDTGETGIAGVTVQLTNAAGNNVLQTATTNASGQYTFTGVAAGDYRVRLAASNFTGTGALVGFTSSTGTNGALTGPFEGTGAPDPDNNADNDDNGQVSGTLGATGFIQSGIITLSQNSEPTNDGDSNPNTNNTLDLGVFRKFSVGNVVFNDLNNNGTRDTGEPGLANVQVRLLNESLAQVGTTTTNAQGQYLFTNLLAGNYVVELAAANFNAGGVLASFQSSTGESNAFEPAPAGATDNQDHGTTNGTLGTGGSVRSGTLALGPGMPTGESPNNDASTPDNQSNLTVDFGVFQQVAAGARISGRVFMDHNNSGTFNSPDFGLQGVVITLSGGGLANPVTVQTDAQGNFAFTNLQPGTYTLTEAQPTTPANQTGKDTPGNAGGNNSVANTISNIVLTANQQASGYLFAEVPVSTITGAVFEDQDGDGVKDAGEPGISGVIITLTGTSVVGGTIASRSALTDTSGNYSFTNVAPGTYAVKETQPAGFVDGKEQNGTPAAATVTNDRFGGITVTGAAATLTGYNFGEVEAGSIAGFVYDDVDDNGAMATTGEVGIAGVTIRLMGTNDLGVAINRTTTTESDGSYSFTGLRPGTYRLIETQPAGYRDGKDTAGTAAGNSTAVNDRITSISLDSGEAATGYLFGEHAAADTVVTMTPVSTTVAPGGTVTITYSVRNRGTASATGVEVTLTYGGMVFVSSNSTDFDSTTRKWTVGDLAADATETITVTLRAATAGTFVPTARVTTTSSELSSLNNNDSSTVFAGTAPTPPPAPPPVSLGSLWFLSSATNARKI